ncbi:Ku protein [Streptomyces sp. NPDC056105]|uniref:non-homologous end joining protein Ku n=1 Tax=Streptomyces sp. NPDC056105 TaxID=3345714 RepID=UPI0035DBBB22
MARAVWGGVLSFGLVSLPMQLFTATDSHTIHFHQLERGTSDRVRNQRVNERTGEEVPLAAVVKGYDVGDEYVLVEPEELEDIAPGRSKVLEVVGFVALDDVLPIFFDKTYYLGPRGKDYARTYALLAQAMERQEKAAIATFVMRNREYLVAVKADGGILTLHTLHWADEIRDPRKIDILPDQIEVDKREMEMAEQLIDALTMEWKPEEFHDTYQDEVAKLVESKRSGKTMEKAEPPAESTNVVDLMEALRASVDRAKKPEDHEAGKKSAGAGSAPTEIQEGAQRRRSKKRAKVTRQGSHSLSESADLDLLTKAELYRRAAEEDVPGRSSMSRDELVKSLSANRHRRRKSSA